MQNYSIVVEKEEFRERKYLIIVMKKQKREVRVSYLDWVQERNKQNRVLFGVNDEMKSKLHVVAF